MGKPTLEIIKSKWFNKNTLGSLDLPPEKMQVVIDSIGLKTTQATATDKEMGIIMEAIYDDILKVIDKQWPFLLDFILYYKEELKMEKGNNLIPHSLVILLYPEYANQPVKLELGNRAYYNDYLIVPYYTESSNSFSGIIINSYFHFMNTFEDPLSLPSADFEGINYGFHNFPLNPERVQEVFKLYKDNRDTIEDITDVLGNMKKKFLFIYFLFRYNNAKFNTYFIILIALLNYARSDTTTSNFVSTVVDLEAQELNVVFDKCPLGSVFNASLIFHQIYRPNSLGLSKLLAHLKGLERIEKIFRVKYPDFFLRQYETFRGDVLKDYYDKFCEVYGGELMAEADGEEV